jgi:hypothetical protein
MVVVSKKQQFGLQLFDGAARGRGCLYLLPPSIALVHLRLTLQTSHSGNSLRGGAGH